MEILIVALVAFLSSTLTLISGFGLGMLLSAAMFLYFPVDVSIVLTAIVHLANNFYKFVHFRSFIDKKIFFFFGIPAIIFAFVGGMLLNTLADFDKVYNYTLFDSSFTIVPLTLVMGVLLITFAWVSPNPSHTKSSFFLPLGGILSGFFGGIAGYQGAIRSSFLSKLPLKKEVFIGSGVAIACVIDITRISTYLNDGRISFALDNLTLLLVAILSAFLGVNLGKKLLKKTTYTLIQNIVKIVLTIQGVFLIINMIK